jgi:hypothetical protein
VHGLLRDVIRPSRIPSLPVTTRERVVALTPGLTFRGDDASDGGGGRHQRRFGPAHRQSHGAQPHPIRCLRLSDDPKCAAKLCDRIWSGLHSRKAAAESHGLRPGDA